MTLAVHTIERLTALELYLYLLSAWLEHALTRDVRIDADTLLTQTEEEDDESETRMYYIRNSRVSIDHSTKTCHTRHTKDMKSRLPFSPQVCLAALRPSSSGTQAREEGA